MSPISDSDLLFVERGGSLYKVTYDRISDLNDTDLLLVERGGMIYKCQVSNNDSIADSDLLLVGRGGTNYKLAGSEITFNSSFITILLDGTFNITPSGFHVDGASNLYNLHYQPLGNSASVVTKLDKDGAFQWSTAIDFKGQTPRDLSSDDSGNIYVSGYAQEDNPDNRYDLFIAKLNSSGALQWSSRLGTQTSGSLFYSDYAYTISTDSSGNSYISGFEYLNRDVFLAKYNSSGTIQWQRRVNGLDGQGFNTAIDSAGYIYLASLITAGTKDVSISKWNSSGSLIWHKNITDIGFTKSLVVDGSDNIYIGANNASQDRVNLIKFNSSGTLQWQKQISAGDIDRNPNVTTTTSGNILVEFGSLIGSDWDTCIIAFDSSGNVQWRRLLDSGPPVTIGGQSNTKGFFVSCEKLNNIRQAILKLPADGSKTGTYSAFSETFTYSSTTRGSVTNTSYSVTDITSSYSVVSMSLFSGPAGFSVTSNATSSVGVQTI